MLYLLMSVIIFIIILGAVIIIRGSYKTKKDIAKLKEMILNNAIPNISEKEQFNFLIGKDRYTILKRLGTSVLPGEIAKDIIKLNKDRMMSLIQEEEYLKYFKLKNEMDGLWIKEIGDTYELVEQDRGNVINQYSYKSKTEMLEALLNYHLKFPTYFASTKTSDFFRF